MTREDAINYLKNSMAIGEDDDSRYHNEVLDFIIEVLKQEPCVTMRDLSEEELKHFAEEMKKVRPQVVKQESCDDCISRQAAIDELELQAKEMSQWSERYMEQSKGVLTAKNIIKDLPPGTLHPKAGHWIETAEEYYKAVNEYGGGVNENTPYFVDDIACSECLAKYSVIDNETERFDHCPSCGAKMVEPQERSGEE